MSSCPTETQAGFPQTFGNRNHLFCQLLKHRRECYLTYWQIRPGSKAWDELLILDPLLIIRLDVWQ